MDPEKERVLLSYSACDVSDALVRLGVSSGGFLPDIAPRSTPRAARTAGPAFTVLFSAPHAAAALPPANIPASTHWADMAPHGAVVVLQQQAHQTNAVCGGIMALRLQMCGARGVLVDGRARDVREFMELDIPVWSKGLSTVGAGPASRPHAVQVPLDIGGTVVDDGDIVYADADNGAVCIPMQLLDQVLKLLPILTEADEKVKAAIRAGSTVKDAFAKYRSGL